MTIQITRNQHWVPRSYLNKFSHNKEVRVLDIKKREIIKKSHSTKSICSGNFYYAKVRGKFDQASQNFENYFKEYEDKYMPVLEKLEHFIRSNQQVSEKVLLDSADFISNLWLRGNMRRKQIVNMKEQIFAIKKKLVKGNPEISEARQQELLGEYDRELESLKNDNITHLKMILKNSMGFGNLLYAKKWIAYITEAPMLGFLTTDTPVVDVYPKEVPLYGIDFCDREQYFALSPKVLLEFKDMYYVDAEFKKTRGTKHLRRKRIYTDNEINLLNCKLLNWSDEYAYAVGTAEFDCALES